jgi:transcriptional regulator with XRE-family HTH domain/KaiC/GvpD/RAD55 family RecA-like ATPase
MFKKTVRVSSGVGQLDQLLGGLFIGDNVVWYDEAGSLASAFSFNFIQESQARKKPLIYITFDRSPKTIIEELGPFAESQYLTILDCFTHGQGDGSAVFSKFYEKDGAQWPHQIIKVTEPWKPQQVSESIYSLHGTLQGDVRFVFETLTGMQNLWGNEEAVLKFYSRSCPRLYELDTIAYWIMEKGAHSDRLKAHINQVAQVAIDLAVRRGRSAMTILKADKRSPGTLNTPVNFWQEGMEITFQKEKTDHGKVDLGRRIKQFRKRQSLSQKELADQVGVTPSTISQIESNSIYPSLTALLKIAATLEVEMGSFFQGRSGVEEKLVFTGGGTKVHFPNLAKDSITGFRLSPADFEADAEPHVIEIPPGEQLGTHFFVHKGDEMGYMLSGELEFTVSGSVYRIQPGEVVYLTSQIPTKWENTGNTQGRMLWIKIK